jgi:hypothetical protein
MLMVILAPRRFGQRLMLPLIGLGKGDSFGS